jgi:phosphate acetyltransferase
MADIQSTRNSERPKEFKNVTFDEIHIGDTAELTVTMKQNQIDVAAIVSGDVDAFYLKGDGDSRADLRKTEAAGAEALISIVLGTKLPGPGAKILHRDLDFAGDVAVGDTLTAKVKAHSRVLASTSQVRSLFPEQ